MGSPRAQAVTAPVAFGVLAGTLGVVGALEVPEALVAALAVAVAYLPSGWIAPAGWPRRVAEAALLPVGYALVMLGDPTMRRMALPPLLLLAAGAATLAAVARTGQHRHPWLIAGLALAVRLAGGLGLLGVPPLALAAALAAPAALGFGLTRWGGAGLGACAALLAGAAPLQHRPLLALGLTAAGLGAAVLPHWEPARRVGRGWLPGAVPMALTLAALAPWGGLPLPRALPAAGVPAVLPVVAAVVLTPFLPGAGAGAAWLASTLALGPLQPAPPDRAGITLTAAAPRVELPPAGPGPYLADLTLANAARIAEGTPVASIQIGKDRFALHAGDEAVEWAHERGDVRARVAHSLPDRPVWRPVGVGGTRPWAVAARLVEHLPAGVRPLLERDPGLPAAVTVSVLAAGPSRPTPPRDWSLPAWLLAAAAVLAALQLLAGGWRARLAWLPWALLAAGSLAARLPVEPLRLLLERHAIDLALAALLIAWLPAAKASLAKGKVLLTATALLLPLALATPHLTPPMYGDEPFHLMVLDSLARDQDLDLSNNYDLEHHPYNRIYATGDIFLHTPVLAVLLLPGYLLAGRAGALVLLALVGSGVTAVVARRALQLGLGRRFLAPFAAALLLTYPIATYSTQVWVELVGALAAALGLLWVAASPPGRLRVTAVAALATAIKTRLGLLAFPVAAVAWWPRRWSRRELLRGVFAVAIAAGLSLAVGWAFLGHPLGYRRLSHLLPTSPRLALTVVGGLLFDPAGGLAFSAPLALIAVLALPRLWRRGGGGERALIVGGLVTLVALLSSAEWYGGGAPPARYLVPLLPAGALAGAVLLRAPRPARRWAVLALPLAVLVWWALLSRPQLSINPGDGGWWLASALARRFGAGAWRLFPSFLVPRPATVIVPAALLAVGTLATLAARRWPVLARRAVRFVAPLWLLVGAVTTLALTQRHDTVVELEEPQVARQGGTPEPPPGTFSRFLHTNGWRLGDGDAVEVPLNLPGGARVALSGRIERIGETPATLDITWDDGPAAPFVVDADVHGDLLLPASPGPGHHRLRLAFSAPTGGSAVLDRLVVTR